MSNNYDGVEYAERYFEKHFSRNQVNSRNLGKEMKQWSTVSTVCRRAEYADKPLGPIKKDINHVRTRSETECIYGIRV